MFPVSYEFTPLLLSTVQLSVPENTHLRYLSVSHNQYWINKRVAIMAERFFFLNI